jgi:hypothetical protein
MTNKTLSSIIFCSLLVACSPKLLHSTQNGTNNAPQQEVPDTFIKEFVAKIDNKKVTYDGNTLTLCANPSLKSIAFNTTLATAAGIITGLIFNDAHISQEKKLWSLIPLAISAFFIIRSFNDIKNKIGATPFIKINSDEIEIYDEKIKLSDISHLDTETFRTYIKIFNIEITKDTTFKLFDKYLNTVLQIKNGEMLPISLENFTSIMQHYLDISKAKEKNQDSTTSE